MSGWIKLDRQIADHWLWKDSPFTKGQAWIDLLLKANHSDAKITIKGSLISLRAGQQARSELTLSKDWGWSRGKVRRFLKLLESDGMIVQHTTHLTSVITVNNYGAFQRGEARSDTPSGTPPSTPVGTSIGTPDGTSCEHHTVHSKECKECEKVKNEKEGKELRALEEKLIGELFEQFWAAGMRKANKQSAVKAFSKVIKSQTDKQSFTDRLVFDVQNRLRVGQMGFSELHPTTYLNGERWEDEAPRPKQNGSDDFNARMEQLAADRGEQSGFAAYQPADVVGEAEYTKVETGQLGFDQ